MHHQMDVSVSIANPETRWWCCSSTVIWLAQAVARVEATTKAEEEERPAPGGTLPSMRTFMPTGASPSPRDSKAAL